MSQPVQPPSGDPISMQAARIASLATAANLVLSGSGLGDRLAAETIALDLMDVAGILAARLATQTKDIEAQLKGA